MTLGLPYIRCRVDAQGQVVVEVDDRELFDFVDDFLTEECGFEYTDVVLPAEAGSSPHAIVLPRRYSISDITLALDKLDIAEVERIYAFNNS